RIGKITAEIGAKSDALRAYQQAHAIREKLARANPDDLDLQAELGADYQAIGRLHQQMGELAPALKSLQTASGIFETLARKRRENPELLSGFASVLNDIGSVHVKTNEPLKAMGYFTGALKLQRQHV